MKKIILLSLFALIAAGAKAQDSTSLYQQFDLCDSALDLNGTYNHWPPGWSAYSVIGAQDWRCETAYGVGNSPCIHINGYAAGASNQNENWLITPYLDLHSYASSVYINFAATYYYAGDSLHVFVSQNYVVGNNPDSSVYTWTELAHYGAMLLDTFYYVTGTFDEFQCDLTPFKSHPCIVGFRYTSDVSNSSVWDLDSVTTGTTSFGPITGIANVATEKLPLTVIGNPTSSDIKLAFDVDGGNYDLAVFDMPGRKLYDSKIVTQNGYQWYNLDNIALPPGMYMVKLSNEKTYGVAKLIIR